jgi:YbgC/YbaW family acyl-CoA thioester hydrolase
MIKTPSSTLKVRFSDCDMFGHLNNARYIDYMINARQDHLKDQYSFDMMKYYKNGLGWVITSHEITYVKPSYFEEVVNIQSSLLTLENDSLFIEVLMMNESRSHIKALLRSKLTFINIKTGKREQHDTDFMDWAKGLVVEKEIAQIPVQDRIAGILAGLRDVKVQG